MVQARARRKCGRRLQAARAGMVGIVTRTETATPQVGHSGDVGRSDALPTAATEPGSLGGCPTAGAGWRIEQIEQQPPKAGARRMLRGTAAALQRGRVSLPAVTAKVDVMRCRIARSRRAGGGAAATTVRDWRPFSRPIRGADMGTMMELFIASGAPREKVEKFLDWPTSMGRARCATRSLRT